MKVGSFIYVDGETTTAGLKDIGRIRVLCRGRDAFPDTFRAAYILHLQANGQGLCAVSNRAVSGYAAGRICTKGADTDRAIEHALRMMEQTDKKRMTADLTVKGHAIEFTLCAFDMQVLEAELMRLARELAAIDRELDTDSSVVFDTVLPPVFNDLELFDGLRALAPSPHPPRFFAHGYATESAGRLCYTEFSPQSYDELTQTVTRLQEILAKGLY